MSLSQSVLSCLYWSTKATVSREIDISASSATKTPFCMITEQHSSETQGKTLLFY